MVGSDIGVEGRTRGVQYLDEQHQKAARARLEDKSSPELGELAERRESAGLLRQLGQDFISGGQIDMDARVAREILNERAQGASS